jgi:aerobic-type carbon monoxide dehydrogenase small subunit (CoxS/CutS family)
MTLRYKLGLTGTKLGCDRAECGACTVLIDGVPHYACSILTHMVRGREITTDRGAGRPDGTLHPVQQAVVDEAGFQCAFCAPGFIMSMVAVGPRQPGSDPRAGAPTRSPATSAAAATTTRSSTVAMRAAEYMRRPARRRRPWRETRSSAPTTRPRPGRQGHRPGALRRGLPRRRHALREAAAVSPMPHARVRRIDDREALAMPGVLAVITADDLPEGDPLQEPLLANEPLYEGEPILAVAAVDEATAADAIEKIEVDLEPLPFALDPLDSLRPGGPNARSRQHGGPQAHRRRRPAVVERWNGRPPTSRDAGARTLPMGQARTSGRRRRRGRIRPGRLVLDETAYHQSHPPPARAALGDGVLAERQAAWCTPPRRAPRAPSARWRLGRHRPRRPHPHREYTAAASAARSSAPRTWRSRRCCRGRRRAR